MELIQDATHKYHFYFSIFSPPSFHGIPLKQLLTFMVDSGNPVRETLISHTSQEGWQASDPEPALHRVLFQSQRALRMQRNTNILFTITLFPQATSIMGKVKGLRGMRFQLPPFYLKDSYYTQPEVSIFLFLMCGSACFGQNTIFSDKGFVILLACKGVKLLLCWRGGILCWVGESGETAEVSWAVTLGWGLSLLLFLNESQFSQPCESFVN